MRRPDPTETWTRELAAHGRVELRSPRGRSALLLLVSVAFTVLGVLMVRSPESVSVAVVGWAAIAFFGVLGIPAIGWQALTGGRRTVVTRDGVEVSGGFRVPWRDVAGIGVLEIRRTRIVLLRLRDVEARQRALAGNRAGRWLSGISGSISGGPDLSLPSPLPADAEAVAAWLRSVASAS